MVLSLCNCCSMLMAVKESGCCFMFYALGPISFISVHLILEIKLMFTLLLISIQKRTSED